MNDEFVADRDQVQQQYHLKVMSELITQAHILGIKGEDLLEFFAVQVQAMLACPPNLNYFGQKARVWILRGFYPGSTLFFKLSVVTMDQHGRGDCPMSYFVKASPMRVTMTGKGTKAWDRHMTISSKELNDNITNRMENSFFNANHEIKKLIHQQIKMPRCISPKGMKLFRYEKPLKGRKKHEIKKH